MRLFVLGSVLTLVLLAPPAAADELTLQNGDRITGTVVRLAGGTLTFRTHGGEITVPWTTVSSLTSTVTLRATVADQGTQTITAITPAGPDQLTLTPSGAVITYRDLNTLGPIERVFTLNGGANAGILNSTGNTDVNSLRIDADVQTRYKADRLTTAVSVNRAEDRGVTTSENWTTSLNYDRFVTSRLFVNANSIFTNDRFRDLDLRTAVGAGLGYQVFESPRVKLTANAGFGWVNEDYILADSNDYTAGRESAALEIFLVPGRLQFFHKHDGYFGLANDDNQFVKTANGVRITVVRNFVTTLQLDVDYDASPSPGRRHTDRTFAMTFGYRF